MPDHTLTDDATVHPGDVTVNDSYIFAAIDPFDSLLTFLGPGDFQIGSFSTADSATHHYGNVLLDNLTDVTLDGMHIDNGSLGFVGAATLVLGNTTINNNSAVMFDAHEQVHVRDTITVGGNGTNLLNLANSDVDGGTIVIDADSRANLGGGNGFLDGSVSRSVVEVNGLLSLTGVQHFAGQIDLGALGSVQINDFNNQFDQINVDLTHKLLTFEDSAGTPLGLLALSGDISGIGFTKMTDSLEISNHGAGSNIPLTFNS